MIANISHCHYDSVKEVLSDSFNFSLSFDENNNQWNLCWIDSGMTSEILTKMKSYQKINHFPAMYHIAHKNHLARNLMHIKRILPFDYSFFPETWLLPSEWIPFKKYFGKNSIFIIKPEALSQGKGIYLTNSPDEIDMKQRCVAQKYMKKPMLIDGFKFDLRIYALVYGCDPLRIYVYHEGLARLATEEYKEPNIENLQNNFIHEDADKADTGNKRSLSFIWDYIDSHGGNSKNVKQEINGIITKTICCIQPLLSHAYNYCQPLDNSNAMCFEILGFDIILDHKLSPWLLEVNHSPSFSTDTPFDHKVKFQLIYDTVRLLNINTKGNVNQYEKRPINMKLRMNKKQWEELKRKNMEIRDSYEMNNLGGYSRIYPAENNNEYYEKIILTA